MRNIKLTLEYDGARYFGFQKQRQSPTVQEALESAAEKLFGSKTSMVGAGRTDRGVHSFGQVVNFRTEGTLPLKKIHQGLNHYLPKDMAVTEIRAVPETFHARFSARAKTYCYRILTSPARSPLRNHTAYWFPHPLDLALMRKGARILEGRHDFRAFHSLGRPVEDTVRTIYRFDVGSKGQLVEIRVKADGFLYKMMRNLVGTLLWLGAGKISLQNFRRILASRDRRQAGPAAPAEGLTLLRVQY